MVKIKHQMEELIDALENIIGALGKLNSDKVFTIHNFLSSKWSQFLIQPFEAKNENEMDSFNEFENIYDSMSQENRTEIARKIIELSCRHSALIDFCLGNGQGKLGNRIYIRQCKYYI